MIEGVAIRQNGVLYPLSKPARHHNLIMHMVERLGLEPPITGEQGFYTTHGRFLTRERALIYAEQYGFVREKGAKKLFSEDLW